MQNKHSFFFPILHSILIGCSAFFLMGNLGPSRSHAMRLPKNYSCDTSSCAKDHSLPSTPIALEMVSPIPSKKIVCTFRAATAPLSVDIPQNCFSPLKDQLTDQLTKQLIALNPTPLEIPIQESWSPEKMGPTFYAQNIIEPQSATQKQENIHPSRPFFLSKAILALPRLFLSCRIAIHLPQNYEKLAENVSEKTQEALPSPYPPFSPVLNAYLPIAPKRVDHPLNSETETQNSRPPFIQLRLEEMEKQFPFTSKQNLLSAIGGRIVNEQLKRCNQMIDAFNPIPAGDDLSPEFIVKATVVPLGSHEGYGMEIEISLQERFHPMTIEQELLFVLDASKNTSLEHYNLYKTALLRSLKSLTEQNNFNIIVIGKKVEKLFPQGCAATTTKLLLAKRFLDQISPQQSIGKMGVLETIEAIASENPESNLQTVLLLTDAPSTRKRSPIAQALTSLFSQQTKEMPIFAASLETKHQDTLKLLAKLHQGEYHELKPASAFVRKFSSLVRSVKNPYMQQISITALRDGVQLFPSSEHNAPLYLNRPYRFFAKASQTGPFEVFLQGMLDGKIVHIRKEVRPIFNESQRNKIRKEILAQEGLRELYDAEDHDKQALMTKLLEAFDSKL